MILLFLISLLLGPAKASAGNVCVVAKPINTTISERVRTLKTQDGRVITIIGQNHGDRLKLRSIKDVVNYKKDSNDLWLWTLESILKSNQRAVQHASEEAVFLSDFLKKNPDVKYIALEMLPETVPGHLKYSEKVRDDLLKESNRRRIKNFATTPYVLGFAGSAVFLKMVEPGLMKNRIFFGAESKEETEIHEKELEAYDANLDSLKKQIDASTLEGQNFLQKLSETEDELIRIYPDYQPGLDDKILASALANTPDKYKTATSNWLSTSLKEMKAMKKRDEKIAEALLAKDGSTVMTIGHVHLDSVASILAEKCKRTPDLPDKEKSEAPKGVQ